MGTGCTNNYPDLILYFDRYGRVIAKYRQGQKWNAVQWRGITILWRLQATLKLNNNKDDREFQVVIFTYCIDNKKL
jgi:hypothetical protein